MIDVVSSFLRLFRLRERSYAKSVGEPRKKAKNALDVLLRPLCGTGSGSREKAGGSASKLSRQLLKLSRRQFKISPSLLKISPSLLKASSALFFVTGQRVPNKRLAGRLTARFQCFCERVCNKGGRGLRRVAIFAYFCAVLFSRTCVRVVSIC